MSWTDVLRSGDLGGIARRRHNQWLARTQQRRADLYTRWQHQQEKP